jgi:two-component system, NarL family, invasion response regulator UvrY
MTTTPGLLPEKPDLAARCKGKQVVICDDHPMNRLNWRSVAESLGCAVVGETATGEDALELLERLRPDLLLLDFNLAGKLNGRDVQREARRRTLVPRVLLITAQGGSPGFFAWIHQEDGPDGVLDKMCSIHEIKTAIAQLLTGSTRYLSPRILDSDPDYYRNPLAGLTRAELQVLRHVAEGEKLFDIARRYAVAPQTIRAYMNNIYCKLGLVSQTLLGAALLYYQWIGDTPPPPADEAARTESSAPETGRGLDTEGKSAQ